VASFYTSAVHRDDKNEREFATDAVVSKDFTDPLTIRSRHRQVRVDVVDRHAHFSKIVFIRTLTYTMGAGQL
jgi:hypothetical protein